jgi:hypothetical protein
MGKQWEINGKNMGTLSGNGEKMGKQWGNNGTEQNSDMYIFVQKIRAE